MTWLTRRPNSSFPLLKDQDSRSKLNEIIVEYKTWKHTAPSFSLSNHGPTLAFSKKCQMRHVISRYVKGHSICMIFLKRFERMLQLVRVQHSSLPKVADAVCCTRPEAFLPQELAKTVWLLIAQSPQETNFSLSQYVQHCMCLLHIQRLPPPDFWYNCKCCYCKAQLIHSPRSCQFVPG